MLAVLALSVAGLAAGAAPAIAQTGPVYAATPPTFGALYRDGPSDRWLLGGTWLYRADTADAGLAAGWWQQRGLHRRVEPGHRPQLVQRRRPLAGVA